MTQAHHLALGQAAETQALELLQEQGLRLLEQNFKARRGELDLVMLDNHTLVIVEVRYRKHVQFGHAAETVNPSKQRRIIAATQEFLSQRPQHAQRAVRFDIVALQADQEPLWLQDAFQTN